MNLQIAKRQGAMSAAIFAGIMFALVSVDARVRDHVADLVGSTTSVAPLTHRLSELGDALWSAVKYQSIENAPLAVFATVGIVLTIFMVKS